MPTINIADLQIKKAVIEVVRPTPYQETQNVTDANGDIVMIPETDANGDPVLDDNGDPVLVPETTVVTVTPDPYVQATIDYILLDDNGAQVGGQKGVAQFGPNSGLAPESIIHPYMGPVLEKSIERATTLFKVIEGLLPDTALAGEPENSIPAGMVQ